ncbi:hypothetical protein LXL04_028892 [Taraxacum kok-saghyz]
MRNNCEGVGAQGNKVNRRYLVPRGTRRVPDPKFLELKPEPVRPDPEFLDLEPDPVRPVPIPEPPVRTSSVIIRLSLKPIRKSKYVNHLIQSKISNWAIRFYPNSEPPYTS